MNYYYFHPSYMVSNASNPVFTLGQKLDGTSTYVYDPSKDIIHVALTSNKISTTNYNPVLATDAFNNNFEYEYNAPPIYYRENHTSPRFNYDNQAFGHIHAPWDYIIFAPENSSIQSGVYKYASAGSDVVVPYGVSPDRGSMYYTPLNISSPTRISEITYNSNGMHAYPPDDKGGSIIVTLSPNGQIGFGGFYDSNPGSTSSTGFFGGSSSYDPSPGIDFRSGDYAISTFDVNGLVTDTFHNQQGQPTGVSPDQALLYGFYGATESLSASNYTVESDKITLRGKDSVGNTITTTEKYMERWPEVDLSLYQETNYPQYGNVYYYRRLNEYYIFATVQSVSGSNKYFINDVQQYTLDFQLGTYVINYPSAHPLRFSTTPDGTHGGGSEYTTGVTYATSVSSDYPEYGSDRPDRVTIEVDASTPTLYYYCSAHPGMGGTARTA